MLEKDIEKKLVREIKRRGGRAFKFVSPGNDGVPDRIVILPTGIVLFTELKTEKGKLSKVQSKQIERLEQLHAFTNVIYGEDGLTAFLQEIDKHLEQYQNEVSTEKLPRILYK